jgi:hypothetical protein
MNVRRRDEMTSITEQTSRQKKIGNKAKQSNATNAGDGFGGIMSFRYQFFVHVNVEST